MKKADMSYEPVDEKSYIKPAAENSEIADLKSTQ